MDIISGIAGILTGGATGLLGIVLQRVFDGWKIKQENDRLKMLHEHELAMKKADAELLAQEWAARTKVAEVEAAGKEAVAANEAFAASFAAEPKRYAEGFKPATGGKVAKAFQNMGWLTMVLVDAVRAVVRPGLTIYLCWITTQMYERSQATLALIDANPAAHAALLGKVHEQIIFTVLYLFTTCVTWWFGTRNKQQPPKAA
jgi:hypothetical protein